MRLTEREIAALKPPKQGQAYYPDEHLRGFGLRISQGGTKTFILGGGRSQRRITIGHYPVITLAEARQKALRILRDRELGIDHKQSPPFNDVYREYLATRDTLRPSTRRADVYLLKPFRILGSQKIGAIGPAQLDAILRDIKAPIARLHAFSNIRNLFRFAMKRGYVDRNPCDRLDAPKNNPPRERVLTTEELGKILLTAKAYGYPFGTIVTLLTCTGQRRQQIGSLRREYIDLENKLIHWPASEMKSGKPHAIPFSSLSESLIKNIKGNTGLIFPSLTQTPFSAWSQYVRKFKADCGFSDWTLHDLRRTCATIHASLSTPIHIIEKLLSHSLSQLTPVGAIYQRYDFLREAREAVERYELHLQTLLEE